MKKYFETPAVNAIELDANDVIMASAEQLVKKNGSLAIISDEAPASGNLWMGNNEGWL